MAAAPFALGRRQRAPVVIMGAHRSGTTATTRALQLLGLQVGQRLDSHAEPKALQQLHERYLNRVGASWYDPAAFLEQMKTAKAQEECAEYLRLNLRHHFGRTFAYRKNLRGLWLLFRIAHGKAWGWKEPRTTLFAPAWTQLFPTARIIHVLRNPLAVASSIRQRELRFRSVGDEAKAGLDDLDYCLRLALTYIQCAEQIGSRAEHYQRVRFEDLQIDPIETLRQLTAFCGLVANPADLQLAAATIKPPPRGRSQVVTAAAAHQLHLKYPAVAALGYGADTTFY